MTEELSRMGAELEQARKQAYVAQQARADADAHATRIQQLQADLQREGRPASRTTRRQLPTPTDSSTSTTPRSSDNGPSSNASWPRHATHISSSSSSSSNKANHRRRRHHHQEASHPCRGGGGFAPPGGAPPPPPPPPPGGAGGAPPPPPGGAPGGRLHRRHQEVHREGPATATTRRPRWLAPAARHPRHSEGAGLPRV